MRPMQKINSINHRLFSIKILTEIDILQKKLKISII